MSKDEIDRLRDLLRAMVGESGRTHRDIERSLDLGHGYLSHLFAGRLELKFKHIFLLSAELGFSPSEFFQRAYLLKPYEPFWPAEDIGGGCPRTGSELRARQPGQPTERDEIRDFVRELVAKMVRKEALLEQTERDSKGDEEERPPGQARRAS